jgi:Flp pilus assembly protein TadG
MPKQRKRPGAAAMEFAIVSSLLFMIFLGMIEVGRAMMVLGALSNAARTGVRAGAITSGDYSAIQTAVSDTLTAARISGTATVIVCVNDSVVNSDTDFAQQASPGSKISVEVRIPYQNVSWLPAGSTVFLSSSQILTETAIMRKEI